MQDFLFAPERAERQSKPCQGGERNRVLLAKQLLKPANILVLDEPTNDLDMATLELLEEAVDSFNGTILLISHDRTFMDNVVTSTWVLMKIAMAMALSKNMSAAIKTIWRKNPVNKRLNPKQTNQKRQQQSPKKWLTLMRQNWYGEEKLSYKEQRELDSLPNEIRATRVKTSWTSRQISRWQLVCEVI